MKPDTMAKLERNSPCPGCGKLVSCVDTIRALSLAEMTIDRHTRWWSRPGTCRARVNTRTQCGSVRGSLYFSTHTHVLYVRPVWGGKIRSPENKWRRENQLLTGNNTPFLIVSKVSKFHLDFSKLFIWIFSVSITILKLN